MDEQACATLATKAFLKFTCERDTKIKINAKKYTSSSLIFKSMLEFSQNNYKLSHYNIVLVYYGSSKVRWRCKEIDNSNLRKEILTKNIVTRVTIVKSY